MYKVSFWTGTRIERGYTGYSMGALMRAMGDGGTVVLRESTHSEDGIVWLVNMAAQPAVEIMHVEMADEEKAYGARAELGQDGYVEVGHDAG